MPGISRALGIVPLAAVLAIAGTAAAKTPDPLPGYPSVDYESWRVVRELEGAQRCTWSPDGSELVLRDRIFDVASGEVVDTIPFESSLYRPTWSPDGNSIVFDAPRGNPTGAVETEGIESLQAEGEGNDLWAYDLPTRRFTRLTQDVNGSNNFARFAHHSGRLAWIRSGIHGGTRFVPVVADFVRMPDGSARLENEQPLVTESSDPAYSAFNRIGEFTADDRGLLVISTRSHSGNGDVWRIDLATREWTNLTDAPSWEEHARCSPNGQKISFMTTRDHPVQSANILLDASTVAQVPAAVDNLFILPFALAGTSYAFAGEQYLANPDGSEPRPLTFRTPIGIDAGWFSRGAEFSPDGSRLALAQRPVDRTNPPGAPEGVVIQTPGGVSGRTPRTLIIEFGRVGEAGCIDAPSGARGGRLGVAQLGRTRAAQRRALGGRLRGRRGGMDRWCLKGGGLLRIGYPTRRLVRSHPARSLTRRSRGRALIVLTTSRRASLRGVSVGDSTRGLRAKRRLRVGRNVWHLARGKGARLVFKSRGGRVLELGIADARLTRTSAAARSLLAAWHL
jgi:WD40-like Beta Propeller Repeat